MSKHNTKLSYRVPNPKTYLVCAQTQLQIQRETQLKLHMYAHLCYQYQHVIQSLKKIKPTNQQKSK